jgi:hypothetical protein
MNRKLFKLKFKNQPFSINEINSIKNQYTNKLANNNEIAWYLIDGSVANLAYLKNKNEPILILYKNGRIQDILDASDIPNFEALSKPVKKYYLCYAT